MENYIIIIIGFICTLVPTLLTLWLNERVKGGVKNSFDEKLSQFQIELNHLKTKENFKFTKLHEKRFEVLELSYKYLNESLYRLTLYVNPLKIIPIGEISQKHNDVLHTNFTSAHNNFLEYFTNNKIYFDRDIEVLLDNYFMATIEVFNDYFKNEFLKREGAAVNSEDAKAAAFAYKKISEIIEPLKTQIENRFRELLGE